MTARVHEMMQTPGMMAQQMDSVVSNITIPAPEIMENPAIGAHVDDAMSNPAVMQDMMQATMILLRARRGLGGDGRPDLTGGRGGGTGSAADDGEIS